MKRFLAGSACALVVGAACAAYAGPLPDALYYAGSSLTFNNIDQAPNNQVNAYQGSNPSGIVSAFSGSGGNISASNILVQPAPIVSSGSTGVAPANLFQFGYGVTSYSALSYSIEVVGSGNIPVSININSIGSAAVTTPQTVNDFATAIMAFSIVSGSPTIDNVTPGFPTGVVFGYNDAVSTVWDAPGQGLPAQPQNTLTETDLATNVTSTIFGPNGIVVNNDTTFVGETNTQYSITMLAVTEIGNEGSASAAVESHVTLSQSFLDSSPAYSLELSEGIGNAPISSAPEPATWSILVVGLGGLGAVLRRHRGAGAQSIRVTLL